MCLYTSFFLSKDLIRSTLYLTSASERILYLNNFSGPFFPNWKDVLWTTWFIQSF